ncbi:MAG: hypothetical protein AB1560_06510 [Pseudomonadota bacterium]
MFLSLVSVGSSAATIEQETLAHLDRIRAVRAGGDAKADKAYNKQMDEAWQFFNANQKSILPILRRELSQELRKDNPNNLFLLDIGYYLYLHNEVSDKELGKQALFRLDTTSEIIRSNQQQLFYFTHAVASDKDPKLLLFLDKAFLKGKVTAFIPQHSLMLDETLVCVFLYGIYGQTAELHLKPLLKDRNLTRKVIEILIWIGSPDSIQDVKAAMTASRDHETFARATAYMMKIGGPQGRAVMLAIKPGDFDDKSQEYYEKVRKDIGTISYSILRKQFTGIPGIAKLSGGELKKRLSAMYENYGKDDEISPEAVLNSDLPRDFLINELIRIRSRMFYRLSDEALSDVVMTNAIMNTLYYKNQ